LRDAARMRERQDAYWTQIVDIQRVTAQAWATLAEESWQEALAPMREAAEHEDATEKATVPENPVSMRLSATFFSEITRTAGRRP
jgi:hypothetical protein